MYARRGVGETAITPYDYVLSVLGSPFGYNPVAGKMASNTISNTVSGALNEDAGTITPPVPPALACAGVINADGSCSPLASVNDPFGTNSQLSTANQNAQDVWSAYAQQASASAQTGAAVSNYVLWLGIAAVGLVVFASWKVGR